ncbi:hypothetical protein GCM10007111_37070 [Virgibacillus kapii]|uniref:Uncharacterized protein n=1 Tax=Virgibacillus kapii TaxID=1638645 RepID=A0ABQ2DTE1_9BACI|nr:hypothetical protein GCM10007111_37070 [Virgibacillus kapii]
MVAVIPGIDPKIIPMKTPRKQSKTDSGLIISNISIGYHPPYGKVISNSWPNKYQMINDVESELVNETKIDFFLISPMNSKLIKNIKRMVASKNPIDSRTNAYAINNTRVPKNFSLS